MLSLLLLSLGARIAASTSSHTVDNINPGQLELITPVGSRSASCFPASGFKMPKDVPESLDGWWCDAVDEYAFLGFSYEVTACE